MKLIQAPYLVFISIIIYACILITLSKAWRSPYKLSKVRIGFGVILIILFSVFSFYDTDYFHYYISLELYLRKGQTHMEEFYQWLITLVNGDYNLFRLAIWGSATLLLLLMTRWINISASLFLLVFSCLFLTTYSYGRVSLAMAVTFLGLAIITRALSRHNILYYGVGLSIVCSAYFLHRSALFGACIALVASVLPNIKRRVVITFLLSYPILVIIAGYFLAYILNLGSNSDYMIDVDKAQTYLESDTRSMGPGELIQRTLMYSPYYLCVIVFIKSIYAGKYRYWESGMKIFGNAAFFCVAIATLFAFNLGANTDVIFYRFLYFAIIPCAVFVAYCRKEQVYPKIISIIIWLGTLGTFYKLIYSYYLAVVLKGAI